MPQGKSAVPGLGAHGEDRGLGQKRNRKNRREDEKNNAAFALGAPGIRTLLRLCEKEKVANAAALLANEVAEPGAVQMDDRRIDLGDGAASAGRSESRDIDVEEIRPPVDAVENAPAEDESVRADSRDFVPERETQVSVALLARNVKSGLFPGNGRIPIVVADKQAYWVIHS